MLNCEVVRLDTKPIRGGGGNTQIVAAWVSYKTVVPTMLFSHGNAVDLGQMLPFYRSKLQHPYQYTYRHLSEHTCICMGIALCYQ